MKCSICHDKLLLNVHNQMISKHNINMNMSLDTQLYKPFSWIPLLVVDLVIPNVTTSASLLLGYGQGHQLNELNYHYKLKIMSSESHKYLKVMYLCYVGSMNLICFQIFELRPFLKSDQNLKNTQGYSPWFFPKNDSEITKNFYYIFLYILMY